MVKPFAAIIYFLTALATLKVGLADFNFMYSIIPPNNWRALAAQTFLDLAVSAIFLLASISVVRTSDRSTVARCIASAAVLVALMLVFIHHRLAWRPFLQAAGTLISAVFIIGSLVREASIIAGLGAVFYAILQGDSLIFQLHKYWAFGGSVQHLLMILMAPAVVVASLLTATYSHIRARDLVTQSESIR
jgi:hypothetical protein